MLPGSAGVRGPGGGNALPGMAPPEEPPWPPHGAHDGWLAAPVPLASANVAAGLDPGGAAM